MTPRLWAVMHSLPIVTRPMDWRNRRRGLPSALVNSPSGVRRPWSPWRRALKGRRTPWNVVAQWSTGLLAVWGSDRTSTPANGLPSLSLSGVRNRKTPWSVPSTIRRAATTAPFAPPAGPVLGMNFAAPAVGVFSTNPRAARSNVAVVSMCTASLPWATSVQRNVPMRSTRTYSPRSRPAASWSTRLPKKRL